MANGGYVPFSSGGQNSSNPLGDIMEIGNYRVNLPFSNDQANTAFNNQNTGFDWGMNPDTFGAIGQGLGGLSSLAQIYGMFQALGLQKKAFKFAQEGTKRNFNASATGFNNEITRRENVRQSLAASNPSTDYGSLQNYGKVEKWT